MNSLAEHLREVEALLGSTSTTNQKLTPDDVEYELLMKSIEFISTINEESTQLYTSVIELYGLKFPELSSLVPNPIDYIRTVQRIGLENDLSVIDLGDILPPRLVMTISVSISTTLGQNLSIAQHEECQDYCTKFLRLYKEKQTLLSYIESRTTQIAPNLSALVGSYLAAQLIGLTGGIESLAKIPACNIIAIGKEKKNVMGMSKVLLEVHGGVLLQSDIVQSAPPELKRQALKILSSKVALAARVDVYCTSSDNSEGVSLREQVQSRIDKLLEPPKARTKKALPIPEEKKKTRRGGARARKMKERFMLTDVRKAQNKMTMQLNEGEYGDSAMGVEALSTSAVKSLRAPKAKESKLLTSQKRVVSSASSGQTSGLSSSLVFTPVQGLELVNPNLAAERVKEANAKWFSANSGFLSAVPK